MSSLIGTSERGAPRVLTLIPVNGGLVRIRIHHPDGRSGAAIQVSQAEFSEAVRSRVAVNMRASAGQRGGPLFAERRGSRIYLWIQNVGANGWSVLVDVRAFETAIANPTRSAATPATGRRMSWIAVIMAMMGGLIALFNGARRSYRSAQRTARALRLRA